MSLADADLEAYLARFSRDEGGLGVAGEDARRSFRTVNYALAVRMARQERFAESAARYELAGEEKRADRMRQLAALHAKAAAGSLKGRPLLLARFHYADFLSRHPNGVYFNDTLWHGYRSYALLCLDRPEYCDQQQSLSEAEFKKVSAYERVFRDAQEERWRAALLFTGIAAKAGPDWLGKVAALRAIDCLTRIHARFGRQEEIAGRIAALKAWRAGKAASVVWKPSQKAG